MAASARAELAAMLARELVEQAKRRGAEVGAGPEVIGVALAGALVYYARECKLADPFILGVVVSAMSTDMHGQQIGPGVFMVARKPQGET